MRERCICEGEVYAWGRGVCVREMCMCEVEVYA